MPSNHHHHHDDVHDLGLSHDLLRLQQQMADRRRALRWLAAGAGAGAAVLVGCGGGGGGTATTDPTLAAGAVDASGGSASTDASGGSTGASAGSGSTSSSTTSASSGSTSTSSGSSSSCTSVPEETAGPYPGDGSNGANALALSGIVRSDIRSSFAGATGVAAGVPLTLRLQLLNTGASCASLAGYAVYLWHCDREGRYSLYSSGVTGENYLRGVQETGSDGMVSFTTIFPGCYSGRMPHMHFEIYRSAGTATSYTNRLRTSQIAFPTDVCNTVYLTASGYSSSADNFARISFATDNVFSDGYASQLATVTGSVSQGYVATLAAGITL